MNPTGSKRIILVPYLILGLICFSDARMKGGRARAGAGLLVEPRDQPQESLPYKRHDTIIEQKMMFVVHVGPHKTGTSTLQNFIYENEDALEALKKDNYQFAVPRKTNPILERCLHDETIQSDDCSVILGDFESFIKNTNNTSNILISYEGLDNPKVNITKLVSYLEPRYKVHIVVYYRRFYDWIHSLYNELFKRAWKRKDFPSFVEWLPKTWKPLSRSTYSTAVFDRYKNTSGIYNVSIANMHYDAANFDSVRTFLCDHVDNVPHACEAAKSRQTENDNRSSSLDWMLFCDRITKYHSIRLSPDDKRWEEIEEKYKNMLQIPRVCLPDDLKGELLQLSIESEVALTPEWWYNSREGLENLKTDFEEKINSKLCSIDAEAILVSPEWQEFLTGLETKTME